MDWIHPVSEAFIAGAVAAGIPRNPDYNSGDQAGVGFVPEENLVGKAQIVMLSWKENANLFKPWTWLRLRLDRFLHLIK